MILPNTKPNADINGLWRVQVQLLTLAQELFGPRNRKKIIYYPVIREDDRGPCIENTPNFDGAYSVLSKEAGTCWEWAIFELAHETLHLMDPVEGNTNFFEEGVAVAFSITAQEAYGLEPLAPVSGPYHQALQLLKELPVNYNLFIQEVRAHFGSLYAFNAEAAVLQFPWLSLELALRMEKRFSL